MDRFPRQIKKVEDVPENFQEIYCRVLEDKSVLLTAIYAPAIGNLADVDQKYSGAYLLMVFDGFILVGIDKQGLPPLTLEIPANRIICVEAGSILLYSWFRLIFGDRKQYEIKILYNTVGADFFRQLIFLLRDQLDEPLGRFDQGGSVKPSLSLKFQNEVSNWMRPGEKILSCVFQPAITERKFIFFDKQIAPVLLMVVTDRQVMLLGEIPAIERFDFGRYSDIYTYFPFSRFESGKVSPKKPDSRTTSFTLKLINHDAWFSKSFLIDEVRVEEFESLCSLMYKGRMRQPSQKAETILGES